MGTPLRKRKNVVARLWKWHRWLGLAGAAFLLVIGLSGTLLVWSFELERLLHRPASVTTGSNEPGGTINEAIVRLQKAHPNLAVTGIEYTPEAAGFVWALLENHAAHEHAFARIETATGRILSFHSETQRLRSFLLRLHYHLFLDRWGLLISGLAGLTLIASSLTGIFLYRGAIRGLFRAPFRLGRGWRVGLSDLHKWVGTLALAMNLLLGGTGLYFIFFEVKQEFFPEPEIVKPAFDISRAASIEQMAAATRKTFPRTELFGVFLPEHAGEPASGFVIDHHGSIFEKASFVLFDAETGAIKSVNDVRNAAWGEKIANAMHALHFGWTGAEWVKYLYTFGGLAPGLLSLTGVWIWRLRRSKTPPASIPAS